MLYVVITGTKGACGTVIENVDLVWVLLLDNWGIFPVSLNFYGFNYFVSKMRISEKMEKDFPRLTYLHKTVIKSQVAT